MINIAGGMLPKTHNASTQTDLTLCTRFSHMFTSGNNIEIECHAISVLHKMASLKPGESLKPIPKQTHNQKPEKGLNAEDLFYRKLALIKFPETLIFLVNLLLEKSKHDVIRRKDNLEVCKLDEYTAMVLLE